MTTSGSGYHIDDPNKIQGRDEIIPGSRNLGEIRLERALAAIADVDGAVLLPGAGAGRYARAIARARPDLDIVAGDLSVVAVQEAMSFGGSPRYLIMDAQQLPFQDGAFAAVIFFDLLEHVPDPAKMLDECRRVLGPNGVLHFFVPLENQPGTLYRIFRRDRIVPIHRWKRDHVGHIQRFSEADVMKLCQSIGLHVTERSHSFHAVGQIHDVIDYWQRERSSGGQGRLPVPAVKVISRGAHIVTWRLAYLEDRLYSGPKLASGLHVTARRSED